MIHDLSHLSPIQKIELLELLEKEEEQRQYDLKYYKLKEWTPYPWQLEFMNASANYKQRMLRSGNQSGKTMSGGIEFAMHLTGLYQDWYEGERVPNSGHTYWCIGINLDRAADILQNELIGTPDIKIDEEIGTKAIPLHCIDKDSMRKDGKRLTQVRIKHTDGGYNTLQFFGAHQGQDQFMGSRVKGIWQDEEPPHNAMDIYAQCLTRTTATDGFVMLTLTPEQGRSPLNIKFEEDETGELYLQQASLLDCPHITPEKLARLKAGWPEHQHEMRVYGLPVIGKGAVFGYSNSQIECDKPKIDNWDSVLWSIDIGKTDDPTVITLNVAKTHDQGLNTEWTEYFIAEQFVSDDDRSPLWSSSVINSHLYKNAPLVVPHDGGGAEGYGAVLKRLGVNVLPDVFHNPIDSSSQVTGASSGHSRSIEAGLYVMDEYFKNGKLKVAKNCTDWFKEKDGYYRTGKTGANAFAGADHCIDSSRYGFMSLIGHRGIPAGQAQVKVNDDWNNGFINDYENNVASELSQFY